MYCLDHNEHTRSYMHETHTHTSNQRRKKNAHKPCVKCVISFITNLNDAFMIERRRKKAGQNCTRTCMREENH